MVCKKPWVFLIPGMPVDLKSARTVHREIFETVILRHKMRQVNLVDS